MTTATRATTKRVRLHEQTRGLAPSQLVDVDAGVIKNVKVLGLQSDNGRRYLPEALQRAAPLYEGKGVYMDHPARPHEQRSARDRIGWLENVQVRRDGLYADLHLLTSDRDTAKVLEAAQKNPSLFGLSHNAEGKGRHEGGTFIVEEITEVRSVDLVADPATNKSLFEGRQMGLTLSQLIASSKVGDRLKRQLLEMGSTCEAGDMPIGDMPVASGGSYSAHEADDPTAAPLDNAPAPDPDWKADLVSAIGKLVQSDDPEQHAMGLKIMKLLKPSEATPTEEQEEDEEGPSPKQEGRKVKAPRAEVLTESRALSLCKTAGIDATADLLEAIKGATFDQALAIIQIAKKSAPPPKEPIYPSAPRSSGRRPVPLSEGVVPSDSKGWAERLLK